MYEADIMIGTPAYHCQVHTAFLKTILDFEKAGVKFSLYTVGNESLITRARNTIVSRFVSVERFSHLLFLDSDVSLTVEGLRKLLAAGKDVVGAPVSLKSIGDGGERRHNVGNVLGRDGVVVTTDFVGTAVLLLARRAVGALIDDARHDGRVYPPAPYDQVGDESVDQFDVFQVGVVDGVYLSEDYWVCHRLRGLGYDVYVDLSVKPRHWGMYQF